MKLRFQIIRKENRQRGWFFLAFLAEIFDNLVLLFTLGYVTTNAPLEVAAARVRARTKVRAYKIEDWKKKITG